MFTHIRETGAGLKLGTSPVQKVGFHGAAPAAQRAGAAQAAVPLLLAAGGVLTFTAKPLNGETVTIGATTYMFKTVLSTGPAVADEVLIGTTLAASITNLCSAIAAGSGAGSTYGTGTTANASATAVGAATTVTLTAITAGAAGNSVATTETSTVATFGAVTLLGGTDAATIAQLSALVNELRAALVQKGLVKGSA